MALGSTLYRVQADVSDVDAGRYHSLPIRVAQHSSEDLPRLVARVLAYCLAYEEGLGFGAGLNDASEPALIARDATGVATHWIDVGHPGADRLHRASKATPRVTVVCHKSPEPLIRERNKRAIHRADQIAVWLPTPELVQSIAAVLERNSEWTLVLTGDDLMVSVGEHAFSSTFVRTTLSAL
jgi:uncharacterized protein YaeQ